MIPLPRSKIPPRYRHYRPSLYAFSDFDRAANPGLVQVELEGAGQYGWGRKFFGGACSVGRFEKTESPPSAEDLKKAGLRKCLVFWIPWRDETPPEGWRRLGF